MELFKPLRGEKHYSNIFSSGFASSEHAEHAKHGSPDPSCIKLPAKVAIDEYSPELDDDNEENDNIAIDVSYLLKLLVHLLLSQIREVLRHLAVMPLV